MKTVRTSVLRGRASQWRDEANVRLRRPDWSTMISDQLPFGQPAADRFMKALSASTSYLEYGSGSSTLRAAAAVPELVSVESDPRFLAAVKGRCGDAAVAAEGGKERQFLWADIGGTGAWGVPTFKRPTRSRVRRWSAYPMAPWVALGRHFRADTVLVDGRFRVACALAVVLMQSDIEWTLLFDDFVERPEYWAIEAFADKVALHGRMAEFRPKVDLNPGEARLAFDRYVSDWR